MLQHYSICLTCCPPYLVFDGVFVQCVHLSAQFVHLVTDVIHLCTQTLVVGQIRVELPLVLLSLFI